MDERYIRGGTQHDYLLDRTPGGNRDDYGANRSSARDYDAAGMIDRDDYRQRDGYRPRDGYGRYDRDRSQSYAGSYWDDGRRTLNYRGSDPRPRDDDRGFFDRAGDEIRSWFGDDEAAHRRSMDARRMREQDDHYREWRAGRVAELDRDYDEYRRENAQRFHHEFDQWRNERQGQRDGLRRVSEHMEVLGSDGEHVGTVDRVRGDRILLTKSDADADGRHHSIPSRWIASVDDKVSLTKTAEEARNHWREEDRRTAMNWEFEGKGEDRVLNRSFSGTY